MSIIYDNTKIKLIYLDTNAISEFISNTNNFTINLEKKFSTCNCELCFNMNNIIELKNGYIERYNNFLNIFSSIPCIIFKFYPNIIREELNYAINKKFNFENISFSVVPNSLKEYDLKNIIENYLYEEDIVEEELLLNFMNHLKNDFSNFTQFDEKYEYSIIENTLKQFNYNSNYEIDLNDFPATRLINKSFYNRIVKGKKENIKKNDIHDIMISSVSPYVDVIITEAYQINLIKEAKRHIKQLDNLQCYKVSDFFNK